MNILFLPIDIDLSNFTFSLPANSEKANRWVDFWDTNFIADKSIDDSGLRPILNQLPFTRITRLFHKIQTTEVPSHVDVHPKMIMEPGEMEHIKSVEPAGYRIVIKGQKNSLSVNNGKEWVNVSLPSVPCCYLLNSTIGYHKLNLDLNRETIYFRGYLDAEKHKELIERSLIKYKDYVVYDENS
jgi:hypothetical protein